MGHINCDTVKLAGRMSNAGSINGTAAIGGICGKALAVSALAGANLSNSGKVTSSGSTTVNTTSSSASRTTSATGGIIGLCIYFGTEGTANFSNGGVVKNTASKNDVGGIVGASFTQYISSTKKGTGECLYIGTMENTDSVKGNNNVGGFTGYASSRTRIQGTATNSGCVKGNQNVGGILGSSDGNLVVAANTSVTNSGIIEGGNVQVGGIAGLVAILYYNDGCKVKNTNKVDGSSYNVGGIVGKATTITNGSGFTKCIFSNEGLVSGLYNVGGIVGYVAKGRIQFACNNAKIKSNKASGGADASVGGIVGYGYGDGTYDSLFVFNCCNYDTISGEGNNHGVGGIIGYARTKLTYVYNNYNQGTIISPSGSYAAGIVGMINSYTINIRNCYSIDTVFHGGKTIATRYAGTLNISNCYVNSDHPLVAGNDNSTTNYVRTGANKGNLITEQSIGGENRSSLYAALHAWHESAIKPYLNSCDWEDVDIPRLSWEVPASKKTMVSRRRR